MRKEFTSYRMNAEGIIASEKLTARFSELADFIENVTAESPMPAERTIAMRKLEEACFYARKCLAARYAV